MPDKKYLLCASFAQVRPIAVCLRQMRFDVMSSDDRAILDISHNEMVRNVRYGTLSWVLTTLSDRANELADGGFRVTANKWYRAAGMISDLLNELDPIAD